MKAAGKQKPLKTKRKTSLKEEALEPSIVKQENPALKKLITAIDAGKKRDYKKAEKILSKLIFEPDAPPEAWLLLGRSLHALGEYSRAIASFNDYLKMRPKESAGYLFAGRSYLALGMPYKAVPFLRKALLYAPGDSNAMALLGTAYLKSKHSQAAVDLLEAAVEAMPQNSRIYRAYLNALLVRGIRLCRLEDYESGLPMLRFVLENGGDSSGSPLLRLELGKASRESGRLDEALLHFTKAVSIAPEDRRIRWSKVSVLLALGKNAEALSEINIIRKKEKGVPELPWNGELVDLFLIRSAIEQGEWRKAAESSRAWLKKRGESAMVHALYAEALRNLQKFEAARNHLLRALAKEPGNIDFVYAIILVSWEAKDWNHLKKALRDAKALKGDPDIIKRFSTLIEARKNSENDAEKENLPLLQNAIRALGPFPELMYALGKANLKLGLLEQAAGWFKKTTLIKPGHEEAALGEIAALEAVLAGYAADGAENKTAAEALCASYDNYLKNWPGNFSIRRERALFLVKTRDYTKASSELEKLLVFEPKNASLRRVLAYSYRKTGRYREAAVFLKALLREKPHDIELLLEYSGCLERTGAGSYAVAVLEQAAKLFTSSPELFLALGVLSFRGKKIEKAFDYLREAAALDKNDPRPYEWMGTIARRNGEADRGRDYDREAQRRRAKPG